MNFVSVNIYLLHTQREAQDMLPGLPLLEVPASDSPTPTIRTAWLALDGPVVVF